MKALAITLAVLAVPRVARADGWGATEGCIGSDSESGGCTCDLDGDPYDDDCKCSTSDPISIGTSLGIAGLVTWRLRRKRPTHTRS